MRAPEFWRRDGLGAAALAPLGAAYAAAGRLRRRLATPERLPVPVICVGNLVAGGAGKTPIALAVVRRLRERGVEAHVVTRGYGGREPGPLRVDPARHTAVDVGDEPLLLAAAAPTWIARRRPAGARAAIAAGAQAVVLDDGHQNPTLHKDLSLVVADGGYGFGNGRVMPAGPLREPIAEGLARADALVILGADRAGVAALAGTMPILRARLLAGPEARELRGRDAVAFAGIGRPEKFFETLRALGAFVRAEFAFPDHHAYRRDEIEPILRRAGELSAIAVTTAKDAVRLPTELRDRVTVLSVAAAWDDPGLLDHVLERLFAGPEPVAVMPAKAGSTPGAGDPPRSL